MIHKRNGCANRETERSSAKSDPNYGNKQISRGILRSRVQLVRDSPQTSSMSEFRPHMLCSTKIGTGMRRVAAQLLL